VVSRKRISCRSTLAVECIASWQGVNGVTCDQGRLQVVASDAEDVVRRLLAADAQLAELEVHRAGLAEAFTELTQEVAS
jgi:ABC-2 type transport system ATP-binding protein